jgi:uncharacterized membrane protein YhaH (DUF805 family)
MSKKQKESKMNYLIEPLKNTFNFSGRSTRTQYWLFELWMNGIIIAAVVIDILIGTDQIFDGAGLLTMIVSLGSIIPNLSITIRRIHDVGKSGWWIFVNAIPFIGGIFMLIMMCTDSEGDNQYGISPKYPSIVLSQDNSSM